MSFKRNIIRFGAISLIGLCALWLAWPAKRMTKPNYERDLGFKPPENATVLVLGRQSGLNSETLYVKMTMDRKTWTSMFSRAPFEGLPTNVTANPFLGNTVQPPIAQPSIIGWEPYKIREAVGGMLNVNAHRDIIYCFDVSNDDVVVGYLIVDQ